MTKKEGILLIDDRKLREAAQALLNQLATDRVVSERQYQLLHRVLEYAYTDSLTGLGNTRSFADDLHLCVERALVGKTDLSVCYGDLDHFKQVNDTLGHPTGDQVLQGVARSLTDSILPEESYGQASTIDGIFVSGTRSYDRIYRFGGDEYALLLPDTDLSNAMTVAERCRRAIEQRQLHGVRLTMGVSSLRSYLSSIGQEDDPRELLVRNIDAIVAGVRTLADKALYAAKEEGRNRIYGSNGSNIFKINQCS